MSHSYRDLVLFLLIASPFVAIGGVDKEGLDILKHQVEIGRIDGFYVFETEDIQCSRAIISNRAYNSVWRHIYRGGDCEMVLSPDGLKDFEKWLKLEGVKEGYNENVLYIYWRH